MGEYIWEQRDVMSDSEGSGRAEMDDEAICPDDTQQRQQPWANATYLKKIGGAVKERNNSTFWKGVPQSSEVPRPNIACSLSSQDHAVEQPLVNEEPPPRSATEHDVSDKKRKAHTQDPLSSQGNVTQQP